MTQIDTNKLRFVDVLNRSIPCEGPRSVPLSLDFSAGDTYTIDLQNMADLKRLTMVQAVYLDNSNGTNTLTVHNPQTGQNVTIAAGRQGYRNVLCPNPASLVFTSQNQIVNQIQLLNFAVFDSDWSAV